MQSLPRREIPVVVVGAGPVGVVTANMLGRRGVACLVVERHPEVYPLPRTVHFDDEVFRILQSIGLVDEIRAITEPTSGLQLMDADLRPFARFHRNPAGGRNGHPEANVFSQPVFEKVLRAGLARFPHVQLHCGAEVVAVDHGPVDGMGGAPFRRHGGGGAPVSGRHRRSNHRHRRHGRDRSGGRTAGHSGRRGVPPARPSHGLAPIRVVVRDRNSGRLKEVHAHAVLGCDGANSLIRRIVGTTMEDLGFSQSWLLIDARSARPLANWDGVHQVCDPERATTYMRVGPQNYRWQFQLRPGDSATQMSQPEMVHRLIAPWLGEVDPGQLDVIRQTVYTFKGLVAHTWRRGRVFLLGDAAHLTPPFLGQGLCAGIRDAANLTWKLALVLQGDADDSLLDSYEAERRRHARRMVKASITMGRLMSAGPVGSAVARGVLGLAAGMPAVNRLMARSPCPPLRSGALVRPSPGLPGRRPWLPGHLAPQPTVTVWSGQEVALDEVLGDGFAVLARGTDWIIGLTAGLTAGLTGGPTAGIDEDTRAFFARLGTRYIGVVPPASPLPIAPGCIATPGDIAFIGDTHGVLGRWLARGRAAAVVLRPDRTVFAAGRRVTLARWRRDLIAAGVRAARPHVPPSNTDSPPMPPGGGRPTGDNVSCTDVA